MSIASETRLGMNGGDVAISLAAWVFYAVGQEDPLLPLLAAATTVAAALWRRGPRPLVRIPAAAWWIGLPASAVAGWAWRAFVVPVPDGVTGGAVIGSFAPASIVLGVLLLVLRHRAALGFAWLAAAWSANTTIDRSFLGMVLLFFVVNVAVLAVRWRRSSAEEAVRSTAPMALFVAVWLASGVGVLTAYDVADEVAFDSLERFIESFDVQIPGRANGETIYVGGNDPGALDPQPLIEVTPPDGAERSAVYLRSRVFERYGGESWRAAPLSDDLPLPRLGNADSSAWRLFLLRRFRRSLPVTDGVASISVSATLDATELVRPSDVEERTVHFTAGERPSLALDPDDRERLLEAPDGLQEALSGAWSRIAPAADATPLDLASSIDLYFEQRFEYSLEPDFPPGVEGLATFLEDERPAYCVHFATAATFLLRDHGVPARVVGGFLSDEVEGDRLVVRTRDAHAWVELFVESDSGDGGRWTAFDPTPSAGRADAVVRLGGSELVFDRLRRALRRFFAGAFDVPPAAWLALAVGLGLLLWRLMWRRRGPSPRRSKRRSRPEHELVDLYRRFESGVSTLLGDGGRDSESDRELIARLRSEPPASTDVVFTAEAFVAAYREARYRPTGPPRDPEPELARFERAVATAETDSPPA